MITNSEKLTDIHKLGENSINSHHTSAAASFLNFLHITAVPESTERLLLPEIVEQNSSSVSSVRCTSFLLFSSPSTPLIYRDKGGKTFDVIYCSFLLERCSTNAGVSQYTPQSLFISNVTLLLCH